MINKGVEVHPLKRSKKIRVFKESSTQTRCKMTSRSVQTRLNSDATKADKCVGACTTTDLQLPQHSFVCASPVSMIVILCYLLLDKEICNVGTKLFMSSKIIYANTV